MEQRLYGYSPIVARPPIEWPDGATVAFYVGLNVEHYHVGVPSTSIAPVTAGTAPDPMNYGWRDYGPRVGIWRMIELLDRVGMTPSVLVNSDVCVDYPEIVEAGTERDWCWVAHGQTNSILQAEMSVDDERAYLAEMTTTIEAATGRRPRGWLGPALTETYETPSLLAELGYGYVLDWCNDDQPYPLRIEGMISVPYDVELNDITLFVGRNLSGPDYVQLVADQLDQLLADANGTVLALPLHPFIVNQPFRQRYLAEILERIAATDGVWLTTTDAIAEHYTARCATHAEAAAGRLPGASR